MEASASTPLRCARCEQAHEGHSADGGHIAWCDCGDLVGIHQRTTSDEPTPYVPAPRQPRAHLPDGPLPQGILCPKRSLLQSLTPRRLLNLALIWGTVALLLLLPPGR